MGAIETIENVETIETIELIETIEPIEPIETIETKQIMRWYRICGQFILLMSRNFVHIDQVFGIQYPNASVWCCSSIR